MTEFYCKCGNIRNGRSKMCIDCQEKAHHAKLKEYRLRKEPAYRVQIHKNYIKRYHKMKWDDVPELLLFDATPHGWVQVTKIGARTLLASLRGEGLFSEE
jgi:hypothetical protein